MTQSSAALTSTTASAIASTTTPTTDQVRSSTLRQLTVTLPELYYTSPT